MEMNFLYSLQTHRDRGQALLAANFYNAETLFAILGAARACRSEIILQTSPSTLSYLGPEVAVSMARAAAAYFQVKAWLHLDHATDVNLIRQCISLGYDSVMIDASEAAFEDNVKASRLVAAEAHAKGIVVEAELGFIPKLGQSAAAGSQLTDPGDACRFVESTGVDLLAVAIGTAHGFYAKEPDIDFARLAAIRRSMDTPLVLHGGSDVSADQWRRAIKGGITKINFATEIKNAFMRKLRETLNQTEEIDLRKVFPPAIQATQDLVASKIRVCQMQQTPLSD